MLNVNDRMQVCVNILVFGLCLSILTLGGSSLWSSFGGSSIVIIRGCSSVAGTSNNKNQEIFKLDTTKWTSIRLKVSI